MHQSVRDAFLPFNEPLEGRVHFMYLDVKSLVSTGVGNLLDLDDPAHFGTNPNPMPDTFLLAWSDKNTHAAASHSEIDQEWRTVKHSGTAHLSIQQKEQITRLRITDQDINQLVVNKLTTFEARLRQRPEFAALDSWPADAQLGLFSMTWAMGPLFRFPNFQAAAAGQDWLRAAKECRMIEAGNPGVIPRNVRNSLLFTLAFWMADPPPGDFTQLIFGVSDTLAGNMRSQSFPVPLNLEIGLQTALEMLGFNPNGLDGVFGSGTRAALNNFEGSQGLPQTPNVKKIGDVPAATIASLEAELDNASIAHIP